MPKVLKNNHKTALRTVMLVAGEASGDALGAEILAALKHRHPTARFVGVGGPRMVAAGLESAFDYNELAVMGLWEVLPKIPLVLRRVRQLAALAEAENVDAVITIDAQDFSKRLATQIKKKNKSIKCLHVVAPTVWAWRKGRIASYARVFDHLFCLFPFEEKLFKNSGLNCTFVGHPAVQRLAPFVSKIKEKQWVALLPGSRAGEITRHWPLVRDAFLELAKSIKGLHGILPVPEGVTLTDIPPAIEVVSGTQRFEKIGKCSAAMAKSGTSNLELAILGVPMVVFYTMHPITYAIAKNWVKIPYMSPVNWLLEKQAVPELLQAQVTAKCLAEQTLKILSQNEAEMLQTPHLARAVQMLKKPHMGEIVAQTIEKYVNK
ncbi:MAG: lipid-A-disaccharide synthase [Alphaproteobacteria bacterium]